MSLWLTSRRIPGLRNPRPSCHNARVTSSTAKNHSHRHALRPGRLEVVHGSMFAGKTEWTIARLRAEQSRGRRVRAFKHAMDGRYDADHLVTHTGDKFEATRIATARDVLTQIENVDVLAIDEGHFFRRDLLPVVEELLSCGKTVIVAGITNDSWGRPFEPMPELAEMADEAVLRRAPCRVCGQPAAYTQRLAPIKTEFMVGGIGEYEPRCGRHFEPFPGPPEQRE